MCIRDRREAVGVSGVSRAAAARALMSSTGKSKATAFRAIQNYMDMMEEDTHGRIYWKGKLSHSVSHETITETHETTVSSHNSLGVE